MSAGEQMRTGPWAGGGWRFLVLLCCAIAAPDAAASVRYEMGNAASFCKEIRLGRWTFDDDLRDSLWMNRLRSSWKDMSKSELLIRATRHGELKDAARQVYAINLASGRVRRSSAGEWDRGIPVNPFGCSSREASCGSEWLSAKNDGPLVIDGREMPKAGKYWARPMTWAAVPSPTRTWILLHSYTGNIQNEMKRWGTEYGRLTRGVEFIQLARKRDAKEIFRIQVRVRDEFPSTFATRAPWLEDELLVLSQMPSLRRLLVCRID